MAHNNSLPLQYQLWTDAQMSNYPPPPQPDQQHYNPLYPTGAGAQQLLDPVQQDQIAFSHLSQNIYPKIEADPLDPNAPNHIEQRIEQLQQQSPLPPPQQHHQHQQHHQQQQHGQLPPPPSSLQQPQQQPAQSAQSQTDAQKANRLRKACDSCSIRKVKCDESGPPCRACAALDIPCTFERPSRRRGPPNRHAEAIKRRRLESPHMSGQSTPSSPTHAAQALAALSSHPASHLPLSAESICDVQTLDLLVNDFFTYVHPLCPFPHEPSFREAWKRREDYNNRPFLALLASMIAVLVASFPRKPRLHLKAQRKERVFPNHMALVHRCQKVCAEARGAGYLESETLSVHDAATSYFLGLTGCYTFRWRQGRLYLGECMTILRSLGLHKPAEQNFTRLGSLPLAVGSHGPSFEGNKDAIDNITQEMGRRIYWTMFVGAKTMSQFGSIFSELAPLPETPSDPYPPLPAEVDDFCIFPHHIEQQPPGLLPMIAGFNANVRIFSSYNPLSTMEMAWGIDSVVDWQRQKKVLYESLHRCKTAINNLPPELVLSPRNQNPFGEHQNGDELGLDFPPYSNSRDPATLDPNAVDATPEERRRRQYEIQKANIYASSLCTRSYIVEKFWNLCDAQNRLKMHNSNNNNNNVAPASPGVIGTGLDGLLTQAAPSDSNDFVEQEMADERESIVKDLLFVLSSIDRVNMEPNADSFTTKIRSVASTLLDVPKSRKGSVAQQADQYLAAFLDILVKLERVSPTNSDPDQVEDEDAELRHWADLRDYQQQFAQQGGMLNFS